MSGHARFHEDLAAYLLGALEEDERRELELHLEGCEECRRELEVLRPAAEVLPRSVVQVEPPARLKRSLMDQVERDAGVRRRRPLRERLAGALPELRAPLAAGLAVLLAAVVFAAGFGVAGLVGDGDSRTVSATVDERRMPPGTTGRLVVENGDALLRVRGMPSLGSRRDYQVWVQRGREVIPQPTFSVGRDGSGAVELSEDIEGARAVLVTREPRGGSRRPSERPVLVVKL